MVPGFEHGIGMMGDEWRIGLNDGPFPYWTNPDHVYQENEVLICAMQYACPEENIGFRYENPIVIKEERLRGDVEVSPRDRGGQVAPGAVATAPFPPGFRRGYRR